MELRDKIAQVGFEPVEQSHTDRPLAEHLSKHLFAFSNSDAKLSVPEIVQPPLVLATAWRA